MRFDLRLHARTASGKECVLETSVYARSGEQLQKEAAKAGEQGPWYYKGTNEPVPETEAITVESVEQLKQRPGKRPR